MNTLNKFCFFAILLFGLESNMIRSCLAQSKLPDPLLPWQVTILNLMADSTLTAHCKSKDDDLGEHVINFNGEYYFKFKENFWQTTLFWCNFSSKHGAASGNVFWPEKDTFLTDNCIDNNCFWSGREDGIHFHHGSDKTSQLMYPWK